jgi:hypothetical protein
LNFCRFVIAVYRRGPIPHIWYHEKLAGRPENRVADGNASTYDAINRGLEPGYFREVNARVVLGLGARWPWAPCAALRAKDREDRWVTPLASKIMKICLRPGAAGSAGNASSHIQLHLPNSILAAAIGGSAIFVGMRTLEHCQKRNRKGGSHD